jgi:hypothetical protein
VGGVFGRYYVMYQYVFTKMKISAGMQYNMGYYCCLSGDFIRSIAFLHVLVGSLLLLNSYLIPLLLDTA